MMLPAVATTQERDCSDSWSFCALLALAFIGLCEVAGRAWRLTRSTDRWLDRGRTRSGDRWLDRGRWRDLGRRATHHAST